MSEDRLPALYEEMGRLSAEAIRWAEVEASGDTALVHVGSADPERLRGQMIEVRREAREKAKEVRAAADKVKAEVESILRRQRAEMEEQVRAALAALEPLQQQVKRMEEGIWTVNLYLGTSEEIVTLRKGKPASIDTPIHLRTSVLAMDEEVASFPVQHGGGRDWQGMDYRDVEMFDEWLTEDPEHLAQCLPEERGVVVFTPRRSAKVYHEDPLINATLNEGNFESYWLIRNGENLYRLRTDFPVGRNLMPLTSEFTALFQTSRYNHETGEHEVIEILPGTPEWERAEKAQDAKRRHFMRVALVVQGLIDRTEMFAPLHAAVNVMQQRTYDDGLVVVINDTEKALTTGREPYFDWIRRLNADLRPGMRVIGTFRGSEWDEDEFRNDYGGGEGNARVHPHRAERPPANTLLLIEGRRDLRGQKGLVVKYKRTVAVYDPKAWVETRPGWGYRGANVIPKKRASAVIFPTDKSIIPFDLVTVEEMQEYLDARTERHAYAEMFPLLQAAIAAKHEEAEAEAPFRDLLARVLADDNGQTLGEVAPHIDGLVHRFKLGNKWHRPLVSLSSEEEAKAIRLIRGEYKRIVGSGADEQRDAKAVSALREHDPEVMFVGRLSSGKYVAFAPQPREYGEGVVAQNLWVREHVTGKTARTIVTREWIIPGVRGNKMTEIYSDERWSGWDMLGTAKDDLTDAEMAALVEEAKDVCMESIRAEGGGARAEFLGVGHNRERRVMAVYAHDGVHAAPSKARVSEEKYLAGWLGAALAWERKDGKVRVASTEHRARGQSVFRGTYSLGDAPGFERKNFQHGPDEDRPLLPPWGRGGGYYDPKVEPIEVDDEVLAIAERVTKATMAVNRTVDQLAGRVYPTLRYIVEQQKDAKVAEIKAKFLADYPDEEMWEERRQGLTKGVRADLEVGDRWHFMQRYNETANGASLRTREDEHLRIDKALLALIDTGYIEWDGLTVGDVYDLLEVGVPDIYEPICSLRLTPPGADE
jgi:hypothetical protein